VFAGAHHVATYSGGASGTMTFTHADWLGTERARTNNSGASCETITSLPFGDWQATAGSCGDPSPLHFTGKQRDTETNNDDFGARYFNPGMARWLTPDWSARPAGVPYANIALPQTLNLYAYVSNNPVTHTDPDGHEYSFATPTCVDCPGDPGQAGPAPSPQPPPPRPAQNQPLNLCAETSGCTQQTDQNGITTVTVKSNDAQVITNPDGSITMTSTTTTQTYKFNQKGQMIYGREVTLGEQLTIGPRGTPSRPIHAARDLSGIDAMHQFGTGYVDMFQRGYEDTRGTLARVPGDVAADARAHPWKTAGTVGEVGLLFMPVAQEYELPKAIGDVVVAAGRLAWDLTH